MRFHFLQPKAHHFLSFSTQCDVTFSQFYPLIGEFKSHICPSDLQIIP